MIFANIKSITIPEGKVKQIKSSTTLIWEKMEEETIEIKEEIKILSLIREALEN